MRRRNWNILVIALLVTEVSFYCFTGCRSELSNLSLLGVAPQDKGYFKELLDGSKVALECRENKHILFTISQLNDNFCDCLDGTDEPGTSACARGKFYCNNIGYTPLTLFSSRVNDGICDCCDGSDEYDGRIKCANTCWEAGRVDREKLLSKINAFKDGVTLRDRLIQEAQSLYSSDQLQLSKLREEETVLKPLVEQLKVHKERIEKAQEEKERKEAELRESENKGTEVSETNKEREGDTDNEQHHTGPVGSGDDPSDQVKQNEVDETSPNDSESQHLDEEEPGHAIKEDDAGHNERDPDSIAENSDDKNSDEISKEDLGRLVASRWTGNEEKSSTDDDSPKTSESENGRHEETPHDSEDHAGYTSETDTGHSAYDDADVDDDTDDAFREESDSDSVPSYEHNSEDDDQYFSDLTSKDSPSWLGKIQQKVRNLLQSVNIFRSPVNISDVDNVRKEYEENSSRLNKIQSRISSLSEKLEFDFGEVKEFYSFNDKCFEGKQNKYTYKICPFKEASQVEGHSTTRLGRWDKFEDSYKAMIFSKGDKCWNGPDRSLKVKLRCGLKNEVADVDEPSRCEYVAVLSTPAICLREKLKDLEAKLEALKRQRPGAHDEL